MAVKVRVGTGRLGLGVVAAWLLAIGGWCWLLLLPRFDERPRIDVTGEVTEVATPVIGGQPALELVLRGQTLRFRVFEKIFAQALHRRVPAELVPGVKVRATVEQEDYRDPYSPEPYRVPTITVDALEIDGKAVLTLADSRRWHEGNRKVMWVLVPVFCIMAGYLSLMLVRRLREERSELAPPVA